eukprot:CAMPEP_0194346942 /NCGR_PEP_ID=MMETSP0171-20130528/105706_1 /TAXON_ID=218684 /ORGANISM="Corethron pennatum, Strain L29A3" /LENGTH=800 /DNA_ID=CAMNT_0039114127 /DNA_START=1649 /DNA_END=4048 /DNA_ORIENTATION=-
MCDFESDIRLAWNLEPTIENKGEQKCSIIPLKEDQPEFTLRRQASLNLSSEKLSQNISTIGRSNNSFLFPRGTSFTRDYGKKSGDDKQVVSSQSQKIDEQNTIVEESIEVDALPQQGQENNLRSRSTDSRQNIAINQEEQYSKFIENQKFCEENLRIKANDQISDKENGKLGTSSTNIEKSFEVTVLPQEAHKKVIPRRNTSIRHNTATSREGQYFKLIEKQTFLEQSLEIKTQDHISGEENKDEKLDTHSKQDNEAYLLVKDAEVSTNISFKESKKGERVTGLPQEAHEKVIPCRNTSIRHNTTINREGQYFKLIEKQTFLEQSLEIKTQDHISGEENKDEKLDTHSKQDNEAYLLVKDAEVSTNISFKESKKGERVTGLPQEAHEKVIPCRNTSIRHNTTINREGQYFKLIEKQTFLEQKTGEENKDEKLDTHIKRNKEAYLIVKDEEISTNISFKESKKGERDSSASPSLLRHTKSFSNAKHYKKPSSLVKILRRGRSLEISKIFQHKLLPSCESLPKLVLSSQATVSNSSDNKSISNIVKLKQLENNNKHENNVSKIEEILKKKTNKEPEKYALVESENNNLSKYNACMNRHTQVMNRHKQVLSDNRIRETLESKDSACMNRHVKNRHKQVLIDSQIHETLESEDSLIEFDGNTRNSTFEMIDTNSHKLGISKDTTDEQKDFDAWYLPKKRVFSESVDEVFGKLTEFVERNNGFFFCSNILESENDDEKSAHYSLKDDETNSHKLFDVFRDNLPEQRTITLQEKRAHLKKTLDILKNENIVENESSINENVESILW